MNIVSETFYYFVDRLEDLCYQIDEWNREDATKVQKWIVMAILGFTLGLIFLSGCTLPDRSHKLTVAGLGVLPPYVVGLPFPVPFIGYFHSEHESVQSDTRGGELGLKNSAPSPSTSTPAGLDEWMCVLDKEANVLHCGSYDAWKRWEAEQMKKNGF